MKTLLLDHLLAADYVLGEVRRLLAQPVNSHGLHRQDIEEWIEQLRDHLNTITVD